MLPSVPGQTTGTRIPRCHPAAQCQTRPEEAKEEAKAAKAEAKAEAKEEKDAKAKDQLGLRH